MIPAVAAADIICFGFKLDLAFELGVDLLLRPVLSGSVLHPFEIADNDTASVCVKVRQNLDTAFPQNGIRLKGGRPVRRFDSRGRAGWGDIVRTGLGYASLGPAVVAGATAGLLNGSMREAINVGSAVWGDLATSFSGVDIRVEGEENLWKERPAIFTFNHQSGLDAVIMMKLIRRDVTGVGKKELQSTPIMGPIFTAAGHRGHEVPKEPGGAFALQADACFTVAAHDEDLDVGLVTADLAEDCLAVHLRHR